MTINLMFKALRSVWTRPAILFSLLSISGMAQARIKAEFTLKPDPPDAGDNVLILNATNDQGQPVDGATVQASVSMPAMGTMPRMEEKTTVKALGGSHYEIAYNLPMTGSWDVTVTITAQGATETHAYSLTTGVSGLTPRDGESPATSGVDGKTTLLPIGPDRLQTIGVRFADAKLIDMQKMVRAVGLVEADNTNRAEVALRFPGYVEKQFTGRVGDFVKAGAPLVSVYSPDLVTAESEFLLAHHSAAGGTTLHASTAERLKNLGLSERDLARIKNSGKPERTVTITAPISGTVLEVSTREGASFAQGQVLYAIGDLSKNYIVARVFQRDLEDLKTGQAVQIISPEDSATTASGSIDLIYPSVGEGEGTANVRVAAAGPMTKELRPGLYVDLRFPVDLGRRLAVPTTAILYSGMHKYVFVDRGQGNLEPREIKTGRVTEEWSEITSGVKDGERVVMSGAFLISSEAQLRSALPKWEGSTP